jgi:hypothetical protein
VVDDRGGGVQGRVLVGMISARSRGRGGVEEVHVQVLR